MLSEELQKFSVSLGKNDQIDEIIDSLKKHDNFYIYKTSISKELDGCTDSKKLFGYNALRYIQLLLYRSKTLIEGSVHSLNNNCALSSVLSVRAHYETTGSVIFLLTRLLSYYAGNIDFERANCDLMRLSLGSTTIDRPEVPKPINVMNLIDATDDFLKKNLPERIIPPDKMFRELYDDLCEFCHPNFHGITSGSEIIHEERAIVYRKTGSITKIEFTFFFHLAMSIILFLYGYEEVLRLINKNEILPIFNEEDIH
jgi:hypothetical protein